jgi:hypothetical protein
MNKCIVFLFNGDQILSSPDERDMCGKSSSIVIVKIGLISLRPLIFFLPFSISFCFCWFRFHFVDLVSFRFCWFRFVSFSLISFLFRFVLYRCPMIQKEYWCLIWNMNMQLCIYSVGVCPFHLVASFKFGNHKSNFKSVERRGIKITEVQ